MVTVHVIRFLVTSLLVFISSWDYIQGEEPVLFCYFSSHAQNRVGPGKFLPEDIDPSLCTHIIYAFANIVNGKYLQASDKNDLAHGSEKGLYARTQALKEKNPELKVLVAVGGWRIGSEPFLPLVASQRTRRIFTRNAIRFLRKHKFDGLDLDWEFPGTRGSDEDDKYDYTKLLQTIQAGFQRESRQTGRPKLLLTMAAAGGSYFINLAYEPKRIGEYLDYMLVMTYNYHGSWNEFTGHHSGMYPHADETGGEREWNQNWTIDYWMNQANIPRNKLVIGISTYGMTFTLTDASDHGLKAGASGAGEGGPYTREEGVLAYHEICKKLDEGWKSVWVNDQLVPYAYHDDQWVGYDNVDSVIYKARNIKQKGLAGAFIWSVEMDDFSGHCGSGKYPLLNAIASALRGQAPTISATSDDNGDYDDYSDDDDYYYDDNFAESSHGSAQQGAVPLYRELASSRVQASPGDLADVVKAHGAAGKSAVSQSRFDSTHKVHGVSMGRGASQLLARSSFLESNRKRPERASVSDDRRDTSRRRAVHSQPTRTERYDPYTTPRSSKKTKAPPPMDTLNNDLYKAVYGKSRASHAGRSGADEYDDKPKDASDSGLKGWQCQSVKMFAGPSACRAYLICVPPVSKPGTATTSCPAGMTYSADIRACSKLAQCQQ